MQACFSNVFCKINTFHTSIEYDYTEESLKSQRLRVASFQLCLPVKAGTPLTHHTSLDPSRVQVYFFLINLLVVSGSYRDRKHILHFILITVGKYTFFSIIFFEIYVAFPFLSPKVSSTSCYSYGVEFYFSQCPLHFPPQHISAIALPEIGSILKSNIFWSPAPNFLWFCTYSWSSSIWQLQKLSTEPDKRYSYRFRLCIKPFILKDLQWWQFWTQICWT